MNRFYERKPLIERDGDIIYFHDLNHPKCVSSFIKVLKDGIEKGYDNFELDFSEVKTIYPNAAVPIAGIIEHYKNNRIFFDVSDNCSAKIKNTKILSPLSLPNDSLTLKSNALNKVWRFNGSTDVYQIVDAYISELRKEERFDKGVLSTIEWAINETMDNVIQHSSIDCGYVMGQLHSTKKYVAFTIFDLGQGIYNSLRTSVHAPKTTVDALTLSIQEEVTRDKKIGQGNGLFGLYSIVKQGNGSLVITSGNGSYMYNQGSVSTFDRIPFISRQNNCTTVDFQLNYQSGLSLEKALVFRGKPHEMVDLYVENLENDLGIIQYKIADHAEGTGTRVSANRVKNEIFNIIKESQKCVVLDFSGVVISSSFADELIAKLLMEMGLFQFNNLIKIKGMDKSMQLVLQRSVFQRIIEEYSK